MIKMADLYEIKAKATSGLGIENSEARQLVQYVGTDRERLTEVIEITEGVTRTNLGDEIRKCTDGFTANACGNSCSFCYMSNYRIGEGKTNRQYSKERGLLPRTLKTAEEFLEDAKEKEVLGATNYKIVGPEYRLSQEFFNLALEAYQAIRENTDLRLCASMGCLSKEDLERLRDVGVEYFNHNLERTDWSSLNSVFTLEQKIRANRIAKEAGLKRCTGLIAGMGETFHERLDTIYQLQDLDVESLPFNVFVPPRPELDEIPKPPVDELLLSIAIARLALPKAQITLNNGNVFFRDNWKDAFRAGASGFGLKGPKDRVCFLPHGRVENDYALDAIRRMGLK